MFKRFFPHKKPGWSPDLKGAHTLLKRAYNEWVSVGCPRDADNPACTNLLDQLLECCQGNGRQRIMIHCSVRSI